MVTEALDSTGSILSITAGSMSVGDDGWVTESDVRLLDGQDLIYAVSQDAIIRKSRPLNRTVEVRVILGRQGLVALFSPHAVTKDGLSPNVGERAAEGDVPIVALGILNQFSDQERS